MPLPVAPIRHRVRALLRDARGVSAVEFAMLLPLMVTLYLGGVELSQGISIDRKVSLTTRAVADLVAQSESKEITVAELTNVMNAAKAVAAPYPESKLKVVVSSVEIDKDTKVAKVDWSYSLNTVGRAKGEVVPLSDTLKGDPDKAPTVIWAEVSYDYTPTIGYAVTGTLTLKDYIFMRPRAHPKICHPGPC